MDKNQFNLTSLEVMMEELATKKWSASDTVFSHDLCQRLLTECQFLEKENLLKKAAIGFGQEKAVHKEIRGDLTYWLSEDHKRSAQSEFLEALCAIRETMNSGLFLGLRREEGHFAVYPPGTGYQMHVDNHRGQGHRLITFILYLNEKWQESDGGKLSLFDPKDENLLLDQINPRFGNFVLFCSDIFPHQVEESFVPRRSLTGWFRNDAL